MQVNMEIGYKFYKMRYKKYRSFINVIFTKKLNQLMKLKKTILIEYLRQDHVTHKTQPIVLLIVLAKVVSYREQQCGYCNSCIMSTKSIMLTILR